tara:strand:- start:527 stop:877 length:351 start_codon:yes stop_codon:yes gene_type:complete
MIEVGRVCMKLAGRDAGKLGVVIEMIDDNFVILDGEVRRRKVNMRHLEPLAKKVEIKAKASHEEVLKALGIKAAKKGSKEKKEKVRPKKMNKKKVYNKPKKEKKAVKKKAKKVENK